jgi:hypothetical protein
VSQNIHDYIVNELARNVDENDLILAVCEQQHVSWNEAKALIDEIMSDHEDTISSRQLPLKTIIAVVTLVIGLTLVIISTMFLVDLLSFITGILSANAVETGELSIPGEANLTLAQLFMQKSPAALPLVAAGLINGLAMIFGSLLGMRESWAWLIDRVSTLLYKR